MWITSSISQNNGGCVAVWRKAAASGSGDCVQWVKAAGSFANGDCVEWVKSTRSQNGDCVEYASPAASETGNCVQRTTRVCANTDCVEMCPCGKDQCGLVHVRDSKDPDGIVLDYTEGEWDTGRAVHFLPVSRSIAAQYENGQRALRVAAERGKDPAAHWYQVCPSLDMEQSLWFDQGEVDAWNAGVELGEFRLDTETIAVEKTMTARAKKHYSEALQALENA